MLEEKLRQASIDAKKRRLATVFILGAVIILTAFIAIGATFFIEHESKNLDTMAVAGVEKSQNIITKKLVPPPKQIKAPATLIKKATIFQPLTKPAITETIDVEGRKAFKVALKYFSNDLEPDIASEPFLNWKPETQRNIIILKNSAVSSFGLGDYLQALELLKKASTLASQSLRIKAEAFNQALSKAKKAKNKDDFETAIFEINLALKLSPGSNEARKIARSIAVLPEILKFLRTAKIARSENNLQTELKNLTKILNLDPSRFLLRDRALFLTNKIKERVFTKYISSGLSHVTNQNLSGSEKSHLAARRLFPTRGEVLILGNMVIKLKKKLKTESLLRDALSAILRDNWDKGFLLYEQAKKIQPNNLKAVNGSRLASSITSMSNDMSRYLNAQHRLASKNIADLARKLIQKSEKISGNSPSLDSQSQALSEALVSYSTKVPVRIISDGLTQVLVRRIGQVGMVKNKTIKLNPGSYTFEGVRKGYKSKLVSVTILPGAKDLKIEVVCNEQI